MTQVAIIGTAGRNPADLGRLGPVLYHRAYKAVAVVLDTLPSPWRLRSGGAPWMDHLAVLLYLNTRETRGTELTLCLPCSWEGTRFVDTGERDWRTNPGGTLNHYHRRFGGMMRANPFADIESARLAGANFEEQPGFQARNTAIVTPADVVVALTWGRFDPESSGTRHAWNATPKSARRIHLSLHDLLPENS